MQQRDIKTGDVLKSIANGEIIEYYFEHNVAVKLEEIVEESKKAGAEVTIINYQDKAA